MKNKYQIRIKDNPGLPEERISRHKDFNQVLANYEQVTKPLYNTPLYKNPKAFLAVLLLLVIAGLVWMAVEEERKKEQKDHPVEGGNKSGEIPAPRYLVPAMEGLKVSPVSLDLQPPLDSIRTLPSGLMVSASPSDFFDPKAMGNPLTGPVTLEIREFYGPLEILVAGIPMGNVDGLPLNASRIVEIRARSGDHYLEISPGKNILLGFPSPKDSARGVGQLTWMLNEDKMAWEKSPFQLEVSEMEPEPAKKPGDDGFRVVELDGGKKQPLPAKKLKKRTPSMQATLKVSRLGFFNTGDAVEIPGKQYNVVKFVDDEGKPVNCLAWYLLVEGYNTLSYNWPITADLVIGLHWYPGKNQTLFGITAEGKLALLRNPAFQSIVPGKETVQEVKVVRLPIEIKSLEDLRAALAAEMPG